MNAERWQRVKDVLDGALEESADARAAYLASACGDDLELRREVVSLLEREEAAEGFIESPMLERRPDDEADGLETRQLGSYELLRRLGRGGMGEVWLARRTDEFDQRVAVKVIQRGLVSDEIVDRFRFERQILAHLEHPNIARLLDGGSTPDGLPYFVMEYVEGEPIHHHCQRLDLAVRQRLELFLAVCDAVSCAHRSLVVHRDLKPANILVTGDGEPKLLDFGIAKLLSAEVAAPVTRFSRHPLTPHYASPEQLRGQAVTTVSDVYSLGILLYQLLTDRLPFDGDGVWDADTREPGPERPSAAVSQSRDGDGSGPPDGRRRRRRRLLAGDLDHIVLKALRPEARDRYASVEQLAADVRRHLDGRPVLARRGTWVYRFGKLVRRRGELIALVLLLLVLGGVIAHDVLQRREVKSQAESAEEVGEFLVELLTSSEPSAEKVSLREILDRGADSVDVYLKDQPAVQATLLGAMSQVYRKHGELDTAAELAEQSLAIRRRLFAPSHGLVGLSLNNLALVRRAQGRYQEAEACLREALPIYRRTWGPDDLKIAKVLNNLAGIVREWGDPGEALGLYREALEMKRRLLGDGDSDEIATALNNYARGLQDAGRLRDAESVFRRALEMRRRLRRSGAVDDKEIAISLNNLAVVLRDLGQATDAEPLLRRSLELRQRVFEGDHSDVARVERNLAVCLQMLGRLDEAGELYAAALRVQREVLSEGHPDIAATLREVATLELARDDPRAAERAALEALATLRATYPAGHWRIGDAESVLGACRAGLGQVGEARELLERGVATLRAVRGSEARETREAEARLAELGAVVPAAPDDL